MTLSNRAAIVGIGATEFSKESGRSELQLAVEAIGHALRDCGIAPSEVDGLTTFTMDNNSEIAVARELGMGELRFFSRVNYGGGAACGTIQQAAMAVATGVADVVVAYRAFNERSGMRFGQVSSWANAQVNTNGLDNAWSYPMGLSTPAGTVAMQARRYMHEHGATSEDFGRVAVADRMIVDPLHLLDCCQETDGGQAFVIVSAERAADLDVVPAYVTAAAQGSGTDQFVMTSYYRDDIGIPEIGVVGRELWRQSGLVPDDMPMAILYDHFTPYVLMQLEELGFCGRGEAKDFVKDGAIEVGGRLPLNTHGGQLGEAYLHGMNGIAEAVRQIRGTSVNPVSLDEKPHVLVTAGTGVPTSGLILSRNGG